MKMRSEIIFCVQLFCLIVFCDAVDNEERTAVEGRGKKKKLALLLFVVDLIAKKVFFVKIFYAVIFFILIHKAGYFFSFLARFLKDKPVIDHDHDHHYTPHHYQEYGPPSDPGWGPYGPYRRTQ